MSENPQESFPNLPDLLSNDTIIVRASFSDWKEAIRIAGEALVRAGAVEPRYVSAMIDFKEKFGPYIVIAPGVAIPHARPEDGVKRPCLCLVTLEKPVEFGHKDNDPVFLIIAFGAIDHKQHLKALSQLSKLLENHEDVERIRRAKTKEEVIEIVSKYKD